MYRRQDSVPPAERPTDNRRHRDRYESVVVGMTGSSNAVGMTCWTVTDCALHHDRDLSKGGNAAGAAVAEEAVGRLMAFAHVAEISGGEPRPLPVQRTLEMDVADAIEFRRQITERMHTSVCACCSRYREKRLVHSHSHVDVNNLSLLSVDGPRTDSMPRHAHTTQSGFCLQPAACRMNGSDLVIDLCEECVGHLDKGRVPPCSLV